MEILFFLHLNIRSQEFHVGVRCDLCKQTDFQGVRYACLTCPDLDFCDSCYYTMNLSTFNSITEPLNQAGLPMDVSTRDAIGCLFGSHMPGQCFVVQVKTEWQANSIKAAREALAIKLNIVPRNKRISGK
jgi:hypothetical protein